MNLKGLFDQKPVAWLPVWEKKAQGHWGWHLLMGSTANFLSVFFVSHSIEKTITDCTNLSTGENSSPQKTAYSKNPCLCRRKRKIQENAGAPTSVQNNPQVQLRYRQRGELQPHVLYRLAWNGNESNVLPRLASVLSVSCLNPVNWTEWIKHFKRSNKHQLLQKALLHLWSCWAFPTLVFTTAEFLFLKKKFHSKTNESRVSLWFIMVIQQLHGPYFLICCFYCLQAGQTTHLLCISNVYMHDCVK